MNVVDNQFFAVGKFLEVVSQRSDILSQIFFSLLEGHKNARLVELRRAVNQELNGQEGFTTAGAAANQRRPAFGQATEGNLVESLYSRWRLGQRYTAIFPIICCPYNGRYLRRVVEEFFHKRPIEGIRNYIPALSSETYKQAKSSISKLTT